MNYNRVILGGNLTRDPETKYLANDRAVCKFGLAINRKYKDQEETTFVDIEAWGKTAELVGQYLAKGRQCLVEGRLRLDQWEDQNGGKRSRLVVVADSVQFIGGKGESAPKREERPAAPAMSDHPADDVPF